MLTLDEWAARWRIPPQALAELTTLFYAPERPSDADYSEGAVLSRCRLAAPKVRRGLHLWRNNRGAGKMDSGNYVRFGLANDTPELGKVCKSGDLIGIEPVLITPAHIGQTIGQFYSAEVKHSGWKPDGSDRTKGQLRWAAHVVAAGGIAKFVTHERDL